MVHPHLPGNGIFVNEVKPMKQVFITKYGDVNVLKVRESEAPEPAAGEVLVDVKAAGVNFADILARQGLYLDAPKAPCVVGYEVSGVVETVGRGVDSGLVGKEVLALTRFGGYSEKVCVPAKAAYELPDGLGFQRAAAIPVNYLTAWQLLVVMGSLKEGEAVLIHNAGGGVGLAALDIAKHVGAVTYGTASPGKHAFLKERGLDHPIDYRNRDFLAEVMALTAGKGVELVIDPIGGDSWKKSYKALRSTGRLGMFGVSAVSESNLFGKLKYLKILVQTPLYSPLSLMNANRSVFGVNLGRMWREGDRMRGWMETILDGVREGWIQPHVDKAFSFERAGEAHAYIEARKNLGKVVLTTSDT